ncbi:hypothetical protein [Leptospira kanakyensis]|uniref:hypothetical protein n=1 Tax=Leptospira kanakyensis TaxID=2484968 RepID=UPI00223D2CFA|nr:hypothetical protein [Leptospira kanakyensis]MCW7471767.1 hypothetical protein [Leptospira kanakyensis]
MGYKGLITLDLPNAKDENRQKFYDFLERNNWRKLDNLTTAWEVSFEKDITRLEAIKILKSELIEAKKESKINNYKFAIQLGKAEIEIYND